MAETKSSSFPESSVNYEIWKDGQLELICDSEEGAREQMEHYHRVFQTGYVMVKVTRTREQVDAS